MWETRRGVEEETEVVYFIFFFNDTATTEIYTLSLHDALPISWLARPCTRSPYVIRPISRRRTIAIGATVAITAAALTALDRKSTRLNSSHANISYAVFCLKKKNKHTHNASCADHSHIIHRTSL